MSTALSEKEEIICSGKDRKGNYTVSRKELIEFAPGGKFYSKINGNYGRYQYFLNREGKYSEKINTIGAMDYSSDFISDEHYDLIFCR